MPAINIAQCEQPGGYTVIKIISLDEIIDCPEILTNQNASLFTSTPDPETIDIHFIDDSLKITEKPTRNKSGILYNIYGQIDLANQSSEIDDFLHKRVFQNVVMIGIKTYGQQKLYGSRNYPLKMIYEHINGEKPETGSIMQIRITGNIAQKPVFISD